MVLVSIVVVLSPLKTVRLSIHCSDCGVVSSRPQVGSTVQPARSKEAEVLGATVGVRNKQDSLNFCLLSQCRIGNEPLDTELHSDTAKLLILPRKASSLLPPVPPAAAHGSLLQHVMFRDGVDIRDETVASS